MTNVDIGYTLGALVIFAVVVMYLWGVFDVWLRERIRAAIDHAIRRHEQDKHTEKPD